MEYKFPPFLTTVLTNLLKRKSTRPYPYQKRAPYPEVRGILKNQVEKCIFCGSCSLKCPANCIEINKQEGTWQYKPYLCILCGNCEAACPVKCLTHTTDFPLPSLEKKDILLQGTPPKRKKEKK